MEIFDRKRSKRFETLWKRKVILDYTDNCDFDENNQLGN